MLQLIAVTTLLFSLLRQQLIVLFYGIRYGIEEGTKINPTLPPLKSLALSLGMFAIPFALAVWYPYVGKIGALLAALAVTGTVYIVPVMCLIRGKAWEEAKP